MNMNTFFLFEFFKEHKIVDIDRFIDTYKINLLNQDHFLFRMFNAFIRDSDIEYIKNAILCKEETHTQPARIESDQTCNSGTA